ncbi:MAG: hypothetical protein ACXW6R_26395, partial [Candidatus Binatia bacterium]
WRNPGSSKNFTNNREQILIHQEMSMSLRSSTEYKIGLYSQNMLPSSIRHSRARGNPGLFCAELAWIAAFAGMTEPPEALRVHIIPSHVFSKEDTKEEINNLPDFVSFVVNRSLQVSNQEGSHWTSVSLNNSNS